MRLIPPGTPTKTKSYVFPAGRLRPYWLAVAGGAVVLALLAAAFFTGGRTVASPGNLSSPHMAVETRCATCHAPAATEVRCEYCHDPFGTSRFENAGHVWFGTRNPALVAKARTVECSTCHSDHHGRAFDMRRVDERDCAACHFRSMAKHPEIALVRAGKMANEGILFTHKRHIAAVTKVGLERCQFCHEPTGNRKGFEAISFDRHCARCHLPGGFAGNTDPMARAAVVLPEEIDAPWATALIPSTRKLPRDKVAVEHLAHRDAWVLYNLWKLSRELDPTGLAAKRQNYVQRIDDLSFQLRQPPTRGLAPAVLKRQEAGLTAQIQQLGKDPARVAERRRVEKALARVRVQLELGPLQMTAPRSIDRPELLRQLAAAKTSLAEFDIASEGPTASLSDADRQIRLAAATALTVPCAKCHVFTGPLMAAIQAARPVLDHAKFNHLPHVEQKSCESCHNKVAASNKAEDVNLPGIANCQTCHRPGKSRTDCAECHYYHPLKEPWPPI